MRRIIVIVGIAVVGLGSGVFALHRLEVFGPNDGLDCGSSVRGVVTLDFPAPRGHARTPDEEIEGSDLWKYLDSRGRRGDFPQPTISPRRGSYASRSRSVKAGSVPSISCTRTVEASLVSSSNPSTVDTRSVATPRADLWSG